MKNNMFSRTPGYPTPRAFSIALLGFSCSAAFAQIAPDAGRTLQQLAPTLEAPKPSAGIVIESPQPAATQAGSTQVLVSSIRIRGNTLFSEAELLAELGEYRGRAYDLGGLRELASRISRRYRQSGYPFTRAYLPAQPLEDGILQIEVLEGRYGEVNAKGSVDLLAEAQGFLSRLKAGDLIESSKLERTTLILNDQPGISVSPIIRPGQNMGTGDLDVDVGRTSRFSGEMGLDNQGDRYTGQIRSQLKLKANSPFMLGDQISLHSLLTEGGMWFGSLGYGAPLGSSGLRSQIAYAHTYYELGKDFSSLDAHGTADVTSITLLYPFIRSQRANITLSAMAQHKVLNDKQDTTSLDSDKSSDSLALKLSFDLRDGVGDGGITFGAVTITPGNLKLDSTLASADRQSAKSEGEFTKINLDVARVQALSNELSLYGRFSGQWANKNLDSSERFGLGGANGVRAYPVGEGYGDEGWLAQIELRYRLGSFSPYLFHDAGSVRTNAKPWATGKNHRSLSGSGFGLRYQDGSFSADVLLAWRGHGGVPQSDTQHRSPLAWINGSYEF